MKVETFKDGELIETTEIMNFQFLPDFYNFNVQMLFSSSYLKLMSAAIDQAAKSRLELLSVRLELKGEVLIQDLNIYKIIWDAVIDSVPIGILTTEDNEDFNSKAEINHIPFRFAEDFKLVITLEE